LDLAHSLTPGGPDIEVLLIAIALFAVGLTLFFQKSAKPMVPVVLLVLGLAVAAGSVAIGRDSGAQSGGSGTVAAPEGLTVEIVSPADGEEVEANQSFEIEADVIGGELTSEQQSDDPTQGHLHIFLDDKLISMPSVVVQEIELEPGRHTIVVEFTTADHRSYEPRITDRIVVKAG
jgi:hypothetical protein